MAAASLPSHAEAARTEAAVRGGGRERTERGADEWDDGERLEDSDGVVCDAMWLVGSERPCGRCAPRQRRRSGQQPRGDHQVPNYNHVIHVRHNAPRQSVLRRACPPEMPQY